jgi:ABC-2 type transport system ATP-binding protein
VPAALSLAGVTKRYGDFVAVSSLSLEVPAGSIYGILGPNGAGKTTTLRMINDIIAPDEGAIRIAGRLGYLPEERGLYPKMKVGELLRFFGELRALSGREATRRADAWLERLGLADWKRHKLQDLSKGMQQKIQFVTAVIHEPDLLILDEPWSGLDPINADVLRDIVLEQKRAGRTILFSTHLMEQAEKICDGVCIIARGRMVLEGELRRIKREAAADRLVALEVELAEGGSADALRAALAAAGAQVRRLDHVEPSLHEIFVDRVRAEDRD